MAYHLYMGKMLCPIAPSQLQLKIANKNKTVTLINDGEVNILKKAGLTEISFDLLLPNVKYPFATYKSGFVTADYFLGELEKLKIDEKPFQFIVTRTFPNGKMLFDTNLKVSLENYEIKEDADQGFDVVVSIKLKQYRDYGTKVLRTTIVTIDDEPIAPIAPIATVEEVRETTNSPEPVEVITHTVVNGDCLWNLAKKYYGDGSKYTAIYEANKDIVPTSYMIYTGQVLTIPAL